MLPTVPLSNYKEYSQVKGSNNKETNPDFLKPRRVWVCSRSRLHMPGVHGKELHFWAFILKYPNQYAVLEKHMFTHAKL